MAQRLYTDLDLQIAYMGWADLKSHYFTDIDDWFHERDERWHTYCDVRDNKPKGFSKERKLTFRIV